jgi:hypothetical protein
MGWWQRSEPLVCLRKAGFRPIAMTTPERRLFDKISQLPPQRVAEVENFVDFIRAREDDLRPAQAAAASSEPSFADVWDNDDDAAYDKL